MAIDSYKWRSTVIPFDSYKCRWPVNNCRSKKEVLLMALTSHRQGRSQDFSVGTHSFPSHLFTPPKKDQSHFRFTCLLFQIACARVLIEYRLTYFSVFFFFLFFYLFFYFIYLFIYFFYCYFQVRNYVFAYR